jgi:penicillin-binding protein 2
MAMEGLRLAVNGEHATGRTLTFDGNQESIFNAEGVKVWGKTGTATAPSIREADPDGPGPAKGEIIEEGDHSWFVVIAGRDRPRYVIAVVIDYGGSGGKVSGPIANQIIHALIAEGYL